MFMAYIVIIL